MRLKTSLTITVFTALLATSVSHACVPGADTDTLPPPLQDLLADGCESSAIYHTAGFLLRREQPDAALPWLRALEARGWQLGLDAEVPEGTEALAVTKRLNARVVPAPRATPGRRLQAPSFFPEGIAADGASGRLFLGSLTENRVAVIPETGPATFWPLPAHDKLRAIYGIKYDADANQLWVLRNRTDVNDVQDDAPAAEILLLDGQTGALVRSWPMPAGTPTELNDLCLTTTHAYVTDSRGKRVLVLDRNRGSLTPLQINRRLYYPNGIVCHRGDSLYVADALGLMRIDAEAGASVRLEAPEGQTLGGLDGLALDGDSIIAVQNGIGLPRLIAIDVSVSPASVTLLDSGNPAYDIPTTVALMNGTAHVIANSQMDMIDRFHDAPEETESLLSPVVILKLRLDNKQRATGYEKPRSP
ncbi:hypothetical protein [Kordiimonas lacus]|uniref:Sugar lactone lactonase YvrE n=1 Tax=Kordiimonas lacus TaxID=637679 RepID=A0A1G7BFG9_9PROT|nr:hypothetical protein [Kordiimonas lacus]SDE24985.1 Sugar lactone lactonase YvrE [Kordiimonas lacus]